MSESIPGNQGGRFWVQVDMVQDNVLKGKVYNPYLKGPIAFCGLDQFFSIADEAMERVAFPQATMQRRKFSGTQKKAKTQVAEIKTRRMAAEWSVRSVYGSRGKCGNFFVEVLYRYNASWQGQCTFHPPKGSAQRLTFRSAMELLLAMREALKLEEQHIVVPEFDARRDEEPQLCGIGV